MERDYETQARQIAKQIGLTVTAAFKGDRCPPWGHERGCAHGDRYRVTLRKGTRTLTFDFWGSKNQALKGERPGYYDILSCVASDASMPTNPDELAEELGPMPPSQAVAAARFAQRLQAFFSDEELAQLSEIQ